MQVEHLEKVKGVSDSSLSECEIYSKNKNISNLYRGINESLKNQRRSYMIKIIMEIYLHIPTIL
jgi:hypothetical protein